MAVETDRQFGESSFQFLKWNQSAELSGKAGAGVAGVNRASELSLNVAAPALDSNFLVLGRGIPFGEFKARATSIAWSMPFRSNRLFLRAGLLNFDKIRGFDADANELSPYSAHTLDAELGWAATKNKLSYGLSFQFAENSIAYANYRVAMMAGGVKYQFSKPFSIGLAVRNVDLWKSDAWDSENETPFPPTLIQAGLAYHHSLTEKWALKLSSDARTRNDEKMVLPQGLEVFFSDFLILRSGYIILKREQGFNLGLGLNMMGFRVDYAFEYHETLSPAHIWTLGIAF